MIYLACGFISYNLKYEFENGFAQFDMTLEQERQVQTKWGIKYVLELTQNRHQPLPSKILKVSFDPLSLGFLNFKMEIMGIIEDYY